MSGMNGMGGMMGMGGGAASPWMIAMTIFGMLLAVALVAALVFVLVAGGRWLWLQSNPHTTSPAVTRDSQ
jgi:hypothetical protein